MMFASFVEHLAMICPLQINITWARPSSYLFSTGCCASNDRDRDSWLCKQLTGADQALLVFPRKGLPGQRRVCPGKFNLGR